MKNSINKNEFARECGQRFPCNTNRNSVIPVCFWSVFDEFCVLCVIFEEGLYIVKANVMPIIFDEFYVFVLFLKKGDISSRRMLCR